MVDFNKDIEIDGTLKAKSFTGNGLDYATPITTASHTLVLADKDEVNTFESETAQKAVLNAGVFSVNDEIYFTRLGVGSFELEKGTNVRLSGVRNGENKFFINDRNAWIFAKFLKMDGSIEVWQVSGRLTDGYYGTPEITTIDTLNENDVNADINVEGFGFSENMTIKTSVNVTQVSPFTFIGENNIILHLTSGGVTNDEYDITIDNGDVLVSTYIIGVGSGPSYDTSNLRTYLRLSADSNDYKGVNDGTDTNITYALSSAVFNDTSSVIVLNDDDSLSWGDGVTDQDFSFSITVNLNNFSETKILLSKRGLSDNHEYMIYTNSSGGLVAIFMDQSTGGTLTRECVHGMTINTTHHIVITKTGSVIKMFIDSVEKTVTSNDTGTYVAMENGLTSLHIGLKSYASTFTYLDGYIRRLGLWNTELSQQEVTDVYTDEIMNNIDLI